MLIFLWSSGDQGTLTKNEQTVTELYTVDETVTVDPSSGAPSRTELSPALRQTLAIGSLCNNALRNEEGVYVGQSTDVALLNVLDVFGMTDQRQVRVDIQYAAKPASILSFHFAYR